MNRYPSGARPERTLIDVNVGRKITRSSELPRRQTRASFRSCPAPTSYWSVGAARDANLWDFCGAARPGDKVVASGVGHDAVVGAAGAGAAGAGAVAGEHLRGGPAVEFHQVSLGPAAVQPGVAEAVPEPVRVHGHTALAAAAGDHLVDPGGG